MKNVVIKNLYAVGMHHYGGKELPIETPMFCFPEPNNRWDPKAVTIFHDREKANKATIQIIYSILCINQNNSKLFPR